MRAQLPEVKPTLVDRIVNYVDPIRGLQRQRARMVSALAGGYGGYIGARKDRRATSQMRTSDGSADADLIPDLPTLRERTRDLSRNAPLAGGAINTAVTNVVGTGLDAHSSIDRAFLGISDEAADAWQRAAEREWWLWALSCDCDATRTQNFAALQDLVFRSVLESGDVFVLLRYIERPGNPYGLALQVIEGDRVCNPGGIRDGGRILLAGGKLGNKVVAGVEMDNDGAPVAYHVLKQHPGEIGGGAAREWDRIPAYGSATGERVMLHLFRRLRPGQTRGEPFLASVIETFKQLDRYTEAEIAAAVVSAFLTVFIKSTSGEGLDLSDTANETGARSSDKDIKLAPAAVFTLADDEAIETVDPKRPNSGFAPFVDAVLCQAGARLEIPFELLIKHFTSSYSAARASLLEAWKFFRSRRDWLAWNFCQPVYCALITEAVATERLTAAGFFADPLIKRAWTEAEWTGPPPGQIDPESEINAAQARVDMGVSTLQEETAALTGGDWETKHAQRVKERRMRLDTGLEEPHATPSPATPPPQAPPRDSPARRERTLALGA